MIIDGIDIDIIRKRGIKNMRLKIDRKTGRPVVTMPWFCLTKSAEIFVKAHLVWLKKQVDVTPAKISFQNGMQVSVLGQLVTICHAPEKRRGTFIENETLYVSGPIEHLPRRVTDFLKDQAKTYAAIRAKEIAQALDLKVKAVSIRDTTSRWGSCSSSGHLSFCWRLVLAPSFVFDYVIAHEVAHLDEMNHSWAFWKKVGQINPHVKEAKKWLAQNGAGLHRFY